jgi:hypothetical protein
VLEISAERLTETFEQPSIIPRSITLPSPLTETFAPTPPQKSKLFPKLSVVAVRPEAADPRPAFLADKSVLRIPDFQATFSDCRIVVRKLKCADLEMSDRVAVLFTRHTTARVVDAIATYETVFLVGVDVNAFVSFHGHPSVRIRHFPNTQIALCFVRRLIDPRASSYLRDHESLHEMLLALFPCVSRALAQRFLRKGNPISDTAFSFEEFPAMNIYVLSVLLDAQTLTFQRNVAQKRVKKAPTKRTSTTSAVAPGVNKVSAPRPGTLPPE